MINHDGELVTILDKLGVPIDALPYNELLKGDNVKPTTKQHLISLIAMSDNDEDLRRYEAYLIALGDL